MAKNSQNVTFYYDTKTGRRVSATTYKRSKAHGGSRYRRGRFKREKLRKKRKIDPAKAIKKVLDELNLPLGGPFSGENGLYRTSGDFSGPPEYLVSILITGKEGDEKIIRKRIRPVEDSEIIEFEPGWETQGETF